MLDHLMTTHLDPYTTDPATPLAQRNANLALEITRTIARAGLDAARHAHTTTPGITPADMYTVCRDAIMHEANLPARRHIPVTVDATNDDAIYILIALADTTAPTGPVYAQTRIDLDELYTTLTQPSR